MEELIPAVCDHTSVGVLINRDGQLLMFERATWPWGVAAPAGHIDQFGTPQQAAITEARQETGLTINRLAPLDVGRWRDNRCRRAPSGPSAGHRWSVFEALEVSGELSPSRRETRNARWVSRVEIAALVRRTIAYAHGKVSDGQFADRPGCEPVWVRWLHLFGWVYCTDAELDAVEELLRSSKPSRPGLDPGGLGRADSEER
ncbi:NUDIX hydrolase [Streptomyces sp. MP131-18]|uniref:NUDIX hydrolase n=1 Tax=Streptomyces sp. MP131-18 TaxID=1857892 RepID=UPI00209AA8BE|nr:NUDIX hydrolase [Streptomyces sp. MP131-18]